MKLQKLYLSAFGPFTDKLLDFTASPARIHLVFGPNEAGKSSALRAMADLRFGIPARSADNFVHDSPKLLLTAVLEDASGQPVAVARRKKTKDPLTQADPATGLPLATPVSAAVAQALTGGMDRTAFERSFGLDHARLRKGGEELLKGEGELGAALFEASAGLQGIKALLASLQDDARKFLLPSAQAVIPESKRLIEEYKSLSKAALTRPAEWKDRQRAVDTATDYLTALQDQLKVQRKRIHTLTELRAVLPLLQQLAQVEYALEAQNTINLLPIDAREHRLAAQHNLLTATEQREAALAEQTACAQAQQALVLEPMLVAHAPAIERVVQTRALARQQRGEQLQLQTQAGQGAAALAEMARRIHPGADLDAVLAAVPGPADRVALDELLDSVARHTQALAQQQDRLAQLDAQLAQTPEDRSPVPPVLLAAVESALQQALALGDTPQRQTEAQREIDALDQRIQRALADLRLPSTVALQATRPLLLADITQAEKSQADGALQLEALRKEDADLQRELNTQQRRQQQLAAVGEIVTAQSLQAARQQRDARWQEVKTAYGHDAASPATLAAFEPTQTEADRQADLLREGAERAAQAAECALRIAEAGTRRHAIAHQLADGATQAAQQQRDWLQTLADANLPPHPPAALREWQAQRAAAVELCERQHQLQREQADAAQAVHTRTEALAQALQAAGCTAAGAGLVSQASAWLRAAQDAAAHARAETHLRETLRAEHATVQRRIAEHQATLAAALAAQTAWTRRLFLPAASSSAATKARLAELAALESTHAAQTRRTEAIAQHQARADDVQAQAMALAALLGEPAVAQIDDFADRLSTRLAHAQAHALQASELARRLASAQQQYTAAQQRTTASQASLQALCTAAGVDSPAVLPEAEDRSAAQRTLQDKQRDLDAQLRQATARPLAELHAELAGRDAVDLDTERAVLDTQVTQLEVDIATASATVHTARQALEAIDTSAAAAEAREQMESAVARLRAAVPPWMQLRLADSLLQEALKRFRERAQAPMVRLASEYFGLITGGRYPKLVVDTSAERPVLQAEGLDGRLIGIEAMSEGTADQLYLALRLAALELQRSNGADMPLVLDDVLMTSDDTRATHIFQALARFAEGGQVLLFTHHQHLVQVGQAALPSGALAVHYL
ncbi:YhaN family protein [Rhodoferax sp.]|uniref:ATP-binding protein n=1 Tax=Rhodoferax sp. TaxID=50421 RepID=UPI0025D9D9BA|nr:YhaN family protein [Rhodoferax sp.]